MIVRVALMSFMECHSTYMLNLGALYTTIYPGVERFLADWFNSFDGLDSDGLDLWIGVDGISADIVSRWISPDVEVHFVPTVNGETPISLRNRALDMIIANYDYVVFADSDDILEPTRVAASMLALEDADVHGCALGLVDVEGNDLGEYFGLYANESPDQVLPRNNFLGLSNSAWRTDMLRRCLPVPSGCVAMDWLLATRAWGRGARISFDRTIRMRYRQYGANTACVIPPFTAKQILKSTTIVLEHYRLVLTDDTGFSVECRQRLIEAEWRAKRFGEVISASRELLDDYVAALNKLPAHHLWWMSVAHPQLEKIWNF